MADTITFAATGDGRTSISITVTPVPGSVRAGGGHDDRGGGTIPSARAGFAMAGSCQAVLVTSGTSDMQQDLASLLSVISPVGPGDFTVTGTGRYADIHSYEALVDLSIGGDAVQTADIEWKGTYNTASSSSSSN